jgi:hypothetical protein
MNMVAALQSSNALSFRASMSFGASVAAHKLKTLGTRTIVAYQRADTIFAVFGGGGEPDVQLLVSNGQATLFRLSLASKAVLKLVPDNGAAFSVPGFFIPFLGLLSANPEKDLFGELKSVTPMAQGTESQSEPTALAAVVGRSFTGEIWTNVSNGLPAQLTGTWFHSKDNTAVSAAVSFADWSSNPQADAGVAANGQVERAMTVDVDALGL